jgi:dTDP-4-dehydrorhamnose reductase
MIKILLTGSNGFLGQHIAKIAKPDNDIQITGWSRNKATHSYCNVFKQINLSLTQITTDLVSDFDVVIHTAALSHVDYCEENRQEAFLINTETTRQLALACEAGNTHLVHISTDFVFPGENKPVTESDSTNPVNYYGRTKEMAELYVQKALPTSCIIRPVLIFGNVVSGTRSNIVLWVKKSLEVKKDIQVTNDHFRTATYVEDLAELCLTAAKNPHPGIFHAAGNSYMSIYEMALEVAETFNLDKRLISPVNASELNAPGKRPPCTHFDSQKAQAIFGFKSRSFSEALKLMKESSL